MFLLYIERLDQFVQVCQRGTPREALDTLFPSLLIDIQARFAHEELLIHTADFADGSGHIHTAQHHEILMDLQTLYQQRLVAGYAKAATELGYYVRHQMMFHVSSADCELARRLLGRPIVREDA
jgi:hemerythrin